MEMARDAINVVGISRQDNKLPIPEPSAFESIECADGDFKILVDVDFEAYRRMIDNRSVKKNCTIPSWLNEMAEKANINFSAVLQTALKEQLHLN